jgi:hypothetical protein
MWFTSSIGSSNTGMNLVVGFPVHNTCSLIDFDRPLVKVLYYANARYSEVYYPHFVHESGCVDIIPTRRITGIADIVSNHRPKRHIHMWRPMNVDINDRYKPT